MFKATVIVMRRDKEGGQRRPQSLSPGLCSFNTSLRTRLGASASFSYPLLINRSSVWLVTIESSRGAGGWEGVDDLLVSSADLTSISLLLWLCAHTHMHVCKEQKGVEWLPVWDREAQKEEKHDLGAKADLWMFNFSLFNSPFDCIVINNMFYSIITDSTLSHLHNMSHYNHPPLPPPLNVVFVTLHIT